MTLQQMKYFVAVADSGSISAVSYTHLRLRRMTGLVKSGLLHSPVDKMRVPFPLMDSAAPIRFSILIVLRAVLTDTPNRSAIFS